MKTKKILQNNFSIETQSVKIKGIIYLNEF